MSETGFSQEEAGVYTIKFVANCRTPSRMKPVPLFNAIRQ